MLRYLSKIKGMLNLPMVIFCLILFLCGGCRPQWHLMRTVDPYRKDQNPQPYAYKWSVSGSMMQIQKFYYTPNIACAALEVDNQKGYVDIYVDPHKTKFVSGKLGLWAMKSTEAARQPIFRRMVMDFYQILAPASVGLWSKYYFPLGVIPTRQKKSGLICFHLIRDANEPQPMKIMGRSRMRLTDVRVAGGNIEVNWIWLEPISP
jgi:hypothetical protein